jgi:hypothetical protein
MSFAMFANAESLTPFRDSRLGDINGTYSLQRTFDYGTSKWDIRINSGTATYSTSIVSWSTSQPPCDKMTGRYPCGTWQQIVMNSGHNGGTMILATGRVEGNKFTLIRTESTHMLDAGTMLCQVSSDGSSVSCSGDLNGNKNWIFTK